MPDQTFANVDSSLKHLELTKGQLKAETLYLSLHGSTLKAITETKRLINEYQIKVISK